MLDLAPWLTPIDGENPSGADLRNDSRFLALELAMQPRYDVVRDERNNPIAQTPVPVDWGAVLAQAEALGGETRDLRLLVIVTRALFNDRGPEGLADGLRLLARTVESHWETLHPAMRPAATPREGAVRRINALQQLQNLDDGLLGDLQQRQAFALRGFEPVSGWDLERGTIDARTALIDGAAALNDEERAEFIQRHEALVDRVRVACLALADQDPGELAALAEGTRAALAALGELEAGLAAREVEIALTDLRRALTRILATLDRARPAAAPPAQEEEAVVDAVAAEASVEPAAVAPAARAAAPAAFPARLASRAEVILCIDRIIEFYDRTEPASPVPFLARRMRRMVPMDFLELLADLAPSGVGEFRQLVGLGEADDSPEEQG